MAAELPHARVDGFDIYMDQLPYLEGLPSNASFSHLDALGEIPDDLIGQHDIVHTRLLTLVVTSGNPEPLFGNLLSMLSMLRMILIL